MEKAIAKSGGITTDKVKADLDNMDIMTFYGHIKFDNTPAAHGLQVGHDMVYIQWMKDGGKYAKEIVWPEAAKTKAAIICYGDR